MGAEPDYGKWIGSRETAEDEVTPISVAGMIATLDRDDPPPQPGDPLPALWHWMYFAPRARASEIGPDGHPSRGGFMPPVPLPRCMFAGGRLAFPAPLRVGDHARREGEVVEIAPKTGRSGRLVFVTVRYRTFGQAGLAVEEVQDIVYREAEAAAQVPAREAADLSDMTWRREIRPDPVLLFRYSALTFNGHRIHYDHPYVTKVEGYPGLIVHGPLIATLLADLARDGGGRPLARFAFRAHRPLFDTAPFTVAGRPTPDGTGANLIAVDPDGAAAMTAEAEYGEG